MELLKFNDAPKSARRGKNPAGFIGAGIMVAVMGLSSTLAGTITIGTGNQVEFGQGVVTTAACDGNVTVTPISTFVPSVTPGQDTFTVSDISVSGIGGSTSSSGSGCLGEVFELRAFNGTDPLVLNDDGAYAITVTLPLAPDSVTAQSNFKVNAFAFLSGTSGPLSTTALTTDAPTIVIVGSNANDTSNNGVQHAASSAVNGINFRVGNLSVSPSITKITLESRTPRTGVASEAP